MAKTSRSVRSEVIAVVTTKQKAESSSDTMTLFHPNGGSHMPDDTGPQFYI